jgi:type I restriction enzyme M protein
MNVRTHAELANFIWSICDLLRGPYKRNEYRKVILPLTVLRRFDCVLADTKADVLAAAEKTKDQSQTMRDMALRGASGHEFYNTSRLDFQRLLDDPSHIAQNLNAYIAEFSENVRSVMERFAFGEQIVRMDEKNLLFQVVQEFSNVDLSPVCVDNVQMGYVFEELIRIGAEQANEEAGEHFTPREVICLMVSLLLSDEPDLGRSHLVRRIYDPACGTGGMLSVAEEFLREHNADSLPVLFGQDYNDESWAVCKSDMLLKGENAENIVLGDTFTDDGYGRQTNGKKWTFDYMLANPPFGVKWAQQETAIKREASTLGYDGRFGAGTPRINDGSLLFLQHMLSKMEPLTDSGEGGSRIAIVFNGSPLFTGDAGSGESNIRRWIIENDWLETIVALPDQLFYNTGISTYIWILTNRKEVRRRGKIQLIDGRQFFVKMRKSLGNKRNELSPEQISDLTVIHGNFEDGETRDLPYEDPVTHEALLRPRIVSKVFDNQDFGYRKITVERPLRLNFAATPERVARLDDVKAFRKLADGRQQAIRRLLAAHAEATGGGVCRDRDLFEQLLDDTAADREIRISAPERKAVLVALGERDPDAEICLDRHGDPESDPELRDTENVPLCEDVAEYMEREVLPHVPDAWVDGSKTKIGYEIPLNRHFYVYEPPRPLEEIEADIKSLEREIVELLSEVGRV